MKRAAARNQRELSSKQMKAEKTPIAVFLTLSSLVVMTAATAVAAGPQCRQVLAAEVPPKESVLAAAVKSSISEMAGGALSRELSNNNVVENSLPAELLQKQMPDHWKAALVRNPKWSVHKTEQAFRRESLRGQLYQVYYSKWTPNQVKKPLATVILQHGFGRSSRYFHDMIRLLTYLGYEVITPDASNVGETLHLTMAATGRGLEAPSPLDDANAIRDIIHRENLAKFVLVGHSRGHAVTSLVAAMPEFKDRILLHVPVNPYVMWINDFAIESSQVMMEPVAQNVRSVVATQQFFASWFNAFFPGVPEISPEQTTEFFAEYTRSVVNGAALPQMKDLIAKSLEHRTHQELVPGLNPAEEVEAIYQVGLGLAGVDTAKRGFDTLPLYNVANPNRRQEGSPAIEDNGFGLTRSHVKKISPEVLQRTLIVWGGSDELVTPDQIQLLLKADGVHNQQLPEGTHYIPSELPYQLVDIINLNLMTGQQ